MRQQVAPRADRRAPTETFDANEHARLGARHLLARQGRPRPSRAAGGGAGRTRSARRCRCPRASFGRAANTRASGCRPRRTISGKPAMRCSLWKRFSVNAGHQVPTPGAAGHGMTATHASGCLRALFAALPAVRRGAGCACARRNGGARRRTCARDRCACRQRKRRTCADAGGSPRSGARQSSRTNSGSTGAGAAAISCAAARFRVRAGSAVPADRS